MREINKKFRELPKEYFAQKLSDPNFPGMSAGIGWTMFFVNLLFYILHATALNDNTSNYYPVIRYTCYGVFIVAGVMFLAKIFWGNRMIQKHKVGYIHFSAWIFGELRLLLFSTCTYAAAMASSNMCSYEAEPLVVNIVYTCGGLLLITDIVLNIVFWEKLKLRVIEGAFKENGGGFFADTKRNRTFKAIYFRIAGLGAGAGAGIAAAGMLFGRVVDFSDIEWAIPLIVAVLAAVVLLLSVLFAYLDALLLGRAHYVKTFGFEAEQNIEIVEEKSKK